MVGDGRVDWIAAAGDVGAVGQDDQQVQVAVLVGFAARATAEEDDLLRLEALHDELRDGLDGVSVERVFNDAHGETLA